MKLYTVCSAFYFNAVEAVGKMLSIYEWTECSKLSYPNVILTRPLKLGKVKVMMVHGRRETKMSDCKEKNVMERMK